MGDLREEDKADYSNFQTNDDDYWEEDPAEEDSRANIPSVELEHGKGLGSWQGRASGIQSRTAHLYNNSEMSDLNIVAVDENWWFGDTVKDFTAHKFLLATASPVLNRFLFEWEDDFSNLESKDCDAKENRCLVLDERLGVTLTLSASYSGHRLEIDGIPPIAAEALLEYIYKDKFNEEDFDNGYSRNLLWRLWHASWAFEMEHLSEKCGKTLNRTMCEDTVFWDLNYAMKYKSLVSENILTKVLKIIDGMTSKAFEHDNFVWLDFEAVHEILDKRIPGSSDAVIVFNNLLRWSLYQIDRTALDGVELEDENGGRNTVHGSDVPLEHRLEWIVRARNGEFSDHIQQPDLDKYLNRGLLKMPWTEMSQSEFLKYVVSFPIEEPKLITDEVMLKASTTLMEQVVRDPERLFRSAYKVLHNKGYQNKSNTDDVKFLPNQATNKSNQSKGTISATEKLSTIFARKNAETKTNSNEKISSPKLLSRSSRLGSIKTKTTPVLLRKFNDSSDRNDILSENDTTLFNSSDQNSRPNSLIIQIPAS